MKAQDLPEVGLLMNMPGVDVFSSFYLRLMARKGTAVARVAATQKLLTYIWSMLTRRGLCGRRFHAAPQEETALRRQVLRHSRRQTTMHTQDKARGEHREAVAWSAIPAGFP